MDIPPDISTYKNHIQIIKNVDICITLDNSYSDGKAIDIFRKASNPLLKIGPHKLPYNRMNEFWTVIHSCITRCHFSDSSYGEEVRAIVFYCYQNSIPCKWKSVYTMTREEYDVYSPARSKPPLHFAK
jgi:hypothetical protein